MIVGPACFGDTQPAPEEMKRDVDEIYKKILPRLESLIEGKDYVLGEDITVIDILYYNEINTIIKLLGKPLSPEEFPHLEPWFNRLSTNPEFLSTDAEFENVLKTYGIMK